MTKIAKSSTSRGTRSRKNSKILARLRAKKKEFLASLRTLRKKHQAYQKAIYAWADEELAKEDLDRLLASKDGLPLEEFIGELEKELQ